MLDAQLARASRIVRDELAAGGYNIEQLIDKGIVRADTAADVVCDMVHYAARTQADPYAAFGATQASMSGGPYSQSTTYSMPVGQMSFTRVHRKRLGLTRGGAFETSPIGNMPIKRPWGVLL
ncbi:phage Gp19/Gp15/Gp42 family protein [Schaalia sp. lx-260]|nr:phage Gp19/Gp15/Gp42 family protein [Schaalia sp. lx-260]